MQHSNIFIQDIEDLIEAVKYANGQYQGQVWWRGQGNTDWLLLPSVFRSNRGSNYEQNIIIRFQQRAPSRYPNCPSLDNLFSWLFLMQHYRLPTRLLDWTESPLTAGFFAVHEDKFDGENGALYALSPYNMNLSQAGINALLGAGDDIADNIALKAFDRNAEDKKSIIAILPSEVDIRLMTQLSVFTIHGSFMALDNLDENEDFLIKFEIQAEAKKNIKDQLKILGIRESNLFPDLEHLAKETTTLRFKKDMTKKINEENNRKMDPGNNFRKVSSST